VLRVEARGSYKIDYIVMGSGRRRLEVPKSCFHNARLRQVGGSQPRGQPTSVRVADHTDESAGGDSQSPLLMTTSFIIHCSGWQAARGLLGRLVEMPISRSCGFFSSSRPSTRPATRLLLNSSSLHGTAHPLTAEWGALPEIGAFQFQAFASCKSASFAASPADWPLLPGLR
jgi:hypothetical protein